MKPTVIVERVLKGENARKAIIAEQDEEDFSDAVASPEMFYRLAHTREEERLKSAGVRDGGKKYSAPQGGWKQMLERYHQKLLTKAIAARRPVSALALQKYGVQAPEDYVPSRTMKHVLEPASV